MVVERAFLDATADGEGDLVLCAVCTECGARFSLMPDESIVAQLKTFLDVHRHED